MSEVKHSVQDWAKASLRDRTHYIYLWLNSKEKYYYISSIPKPVMYNTSYLTFMQLNTTFPITYVFYDFKGFM